METDLVNRIRRAMREPYRRIPVQALRETDSTNLRLKEWARAGQIVPPYLLMAESQTAGRGRLGRSFVSPPGTGLYMSLLASPAAGTDAGKITILSAVAVCLAIEETTDLRPKIKWVNDLFVAGRKVCGILAEGMDQGVIIGIGVNLKTPPGGFPPEAGIAGALNRDVDGGDLAGHIANHLLTMLEAPDDPAILDAYRARMSLIGAEIQYTQQGKAKNAQVLGVAEDGGLMVQGPDGPETLRTGEVTLGSAALSHLLQ